MHIAEQLSQIEKNLDISIIFKASFDKANRSSLKSYRGPGLEKGLEILSEVRQKTKLPVVTDVMNPNKPPKPQKLLIACRSQLSSADKRIYWLPVLRPQDL